MNNLWLKREFREGDYFVVIANIFLFVTIKTQFSQVQNYYLVK